MLAHPDVALVAAQVEFAEGFACAVYGFVPFGGHAQPEPVVHAQPHRRDLDPVAAVLRFQFQLAFVQNQQRAVVFEQHVHDEQRSAADHLFFQHEAAAAHRIVRFDIGDFRDSQTLRQRIQRRPVAHDAKAFVIQFKCNHCSHLHREAVGFIIIEKFSKVNCKRRRNLL